MAGKRLVVAQESNPTGRFNEGLLKTLTGGDRQKASRKYEHEFEFDPLFTLILAANHWPRVIDQSDAIKARIKLIPFTVGIPEAERDMKLIDKLWAERDGILTWCVRGAVEWGKGGLNYPAQVRDASKDYFADQDVVGEWLAECAEEGPYEFPAGLAYDSFKWFAESNNYFVMDNREFKSALEQRGFQHRKGMRGRSWKGFKVTRLSGKYDPEPELPTSVLD
jgi:putative DNA primase/helicase